MSNGLNFTVVSEKRCQLLAPNMLGTQNDQTQF